MRTTKREIRVRALISLRECVKTLPFLNLSLTLKQNEQFCFMKDAEIFLADCLEKRMDRETWLHQLEGFFTQNYMESFFDFRIQYEAGREKDLKKLSRLADYIYWEGYAFVAGQTEFNVPIRANYHGVFLDGLRDHAVEFYDFLGELYGELELGNEKNGQFFTLDTNAKFMGQISAEGIEDAVKEKGFVTLMEPASGIGSMILGFLAAIKKKRLDYKTQCAVLAVDNDIRCVHMCYIQLALYGVPAVVQHGDSLALKTYSRWYTPVYIMDQWVWRYGLTMTEGKDFENERLKCFQQPMYGFIVYGFPSPEAA